MGVGVGVGVLVGNGVAVGVGVGVDVGTMGVRVAVGVGSGSSVWHPARSTTDSGHRIAAAVHCPLLEVQGLPSHLSVHTTFPAVRFSSCSSHCSTNVRACAAEVTSPAACASASSAAAFPTEGAGGTPGRAGLALAIAASEQRPPCNGIGSPR